MPRSSLQGPTCQASPPRESFPQIPQFTGCLAAAGGRPLSRAHLTAVPAGSRPVSRFPSAPPIARCLSQPAYYSLPHLSPAAPWELPGSWISGRPALGTMDGGQDGPEGSGDFNSSTPAPSFKLMRFFSIVKMSTSSAWPVC